jgi:hypothetical protein
MAESGKDNKTPVMGMVERDGYAELTVIGQNTFKEVVRQRIYPNAFIDLEINRKLILACPSCFSGMRFNIELVMHFPFK